MTDHSLSPGVVVGGLTLAATTGALLAIGHRAGSVELPFAALGALLVHRTVSVTAPTLIWSGILVHLIAAVVWTMAALMLWRGIRSTLIAAAAVAALEFFCSGAAARWAAGGLASVLPLGDRLVFALVLGAVLAIGIRLAFSSDAGSTSRDALPPLGM